MQVTAGSPEGKEQANAGEAVGRLISHSLEGTEAGHAKGPRPRIQKGRAEISWTGLRGWPGLRALQRLLRTSRGAEA